MQECKGGAGTICVEGEGQRPVLTPWTILPFAIVMGRSERFSRDPHTGNLPMLLALSGLASQQDACYRSPLTVPCFRV